MNRRRNSLAASPLLIGAITTLIVVVAVFLSYNANNGLPFVPTYDVKVELPEAAGLQTSNQVRIAGTRVGIIGTLTPHQNPRTGRLTAIATLKLEKKVEPLPADTKAVVQSVSAIGLKYLELEKGSSRTTLKPGQTIPIAQTREPVNIEELFNMFNKPTRTAIKINTNNFGDGLAGRGLGINNAIHELRPLVTAAIPVLRNLANPATGLHELCVALDRVASQSAPVAQTQAELLQRPRHLLQRLGERRAFDRSRQQGRAGVAANRRPTRFRTRRPSTTTSPSSCTCCAPARAPCARSRRSSGTPSASAPSTSPPPPR